MTYLEFLDLIAPHSKDFTRMLKERMDKEESTMIDMKSLRGDIEEKLHRFLKGVVFNSL
jgi:hypothetical protein